MNEASLSVSTPTGDIELDPEVESRQGPRAHAGDHRPHLLPDGLQRVEPPHHVGRVAAGQDTAGVVEHQPEVLLLAELEVIHDQLEELGAPSLLLHVEYLKRVMETVKCT